MARALRVQFPGAFYHITDRGIERRRIYVDDRDRRKFLAFLSDSLATYQVVLHAYILMDNHFHLLIQTRKANCSEFMRRFNICYTGWFNWRHRRSGNLYQGRYQAFLVDADHYLLEVSRYLHLNRVRSRGIRLDYRAQWRRASDYRWSSLAGYVNEDRVMRYVDYDLILSMIGDRHEYRAFVVDGLKRGIEDPFQKVQKRFILGDSEFVAEVKRHLRHGSRREQPPYRELVMRVLEPEVLMGVIMREFRVSKETLGQRGTNGVLRGIVAELLYKYCDITQGEIGALLGGIDYVSVHQLRRRLRQKMIDRQEVKKRFDVIEAVIKHTCTM